MSKHDSQRPYLASHVILKENGLVAFVLRENTSWMNSHYGLPSGKVERQESCQKAAVREALEEAGVVLKEKDLKFVHAMHRISSKEDSEWMYVYFEVKKWEGEAYNAEPHLHSELVWLDPKDLPENIIPSVRHMLEQAEAGNYFSEYIEL